MAMRDVYNQLAIAKYKIETTFLYPVGTCVNVFLKSIPPIQVIKRFPNNNYIFFLVDRHVGFLVL